MKLQYFGKIPNMELTLEIKIVIQYMTTFYSYSTMNKNSYQLFHLNEHESRITTEYSDTVNR